MPRFDYPVLRTTRYVMVHAPHLVRYGSKPSRELARNPRLQNQMDQHMRGYQDALGYAPNQAFIGAMYPDELKSVASPWYRNLLPAPQRRGPFGEIMAEDEFYGVLKIADDFDLVWLEQSFAREISARLAVHPVINKSDLQKLAEGRTYERIDEQITAYAAIPLYVDGGRIAGCVLSGHEDDPALAPERLLENLACKAIAALALRDVQRAGGIDAASTDFILGCGEEAVGDRYNPGGGNLAKAVGEMAGCVAAAAADIKDFCCAPLQALTIAGGMVASGLHRNVAVIGGCSLAKLGMKFEGHVRSDMPILEDMLAGFATLVAVNDGASPVMRLDAIGRHNIGAGSSQQNIMEKLVTEPLQRIGWKLGDVDKYATELHNPELTEPSGSGNVPLTNYRMIAALAALRAEIPRADVASFVERHGMPGYSPTQGHIASAVPFLAHAQDRIMRGGMASAMFLAKGSLFLGRMTQLADGVSFLIEKNPR